MTSNTSRARAARRAALCLSTVLAVGFPNSLAAQVADLPEPPVRQPTDERGVDLTTGSVAPQGQTLTIGGAGSSLDVRVEPQAARWLNSWRYHIKSISATQVQVILGDRSLLFTSNSTGGYTNDQGSGETLAAAGLGFTFSARDGTAITFSRDQTTGSYINYGSGKKTIALAQQIRYPTGEYINFFYKDDLRSGLNDTISFVTLKSLTSSNGYLLKISGIPSDQTTTNYSASVTLINTSIEYCDPSLDACANITNSWPKLTLSNANNIASITDALNRTSVYTFGSSAGVSLGKLVGIRRPSSATDNVVIAYGADGRVSSVSVDGMTWAYAWSYAAPNMTTTITKPGGAQVVYVTDTSKKQVLSFKDELNRTTSYTYDANARLASVTYPEGNQLTYTYDSRGNVTQRMAIAKPGSGDASIVNTAGFDATCVQASKCNKPNWTRDALNNQTDYTYDPVHGGLLTVTSPADSAGVRPQTRITYSALQAYYKNAAGSVVASGVTHYLPTSSSQCLTGSSCTGTASERVTTINYGPQSAGTANNLLPVSQTVAAGNGSVSSTTAQTYDAVGNVKTVDGPLPGSADTVTMRYDAGRQLVGTVGPDPDGVAGQGQPPVAQRNTYNLDGQVTQTEVGNVADASDAAWSNFSSAQQSQTTYDAAARPIKQEVKAGGTTYAVTQTSYDNNGRVDCTAVRMNPAAFTALPADACTQSTNGANGPDRITKVAYDAASEVTQVTTGYGQAEQVVETTGYTANGKTAYVVDGENNRTTLEYDGHDRQVKTRLPAPTTGANTSSTTDYEQVTYNANGGVTQRRLRDGGTIGFTYDNLGRMTSATPAGESAVNYQYDLVGNLTQAQRPADGATLTQAYDPLGRLLSQNQPFGSASYQYDAGGRMTRLTWGDGFYANYDYDNAGKVTAIRENGATSGVGVLASYSYDNLGRRTAITRGNGTTTSYAFDPISRLTSLGQDLAGTASDQTIGSIGYNPAGQITAQTKSNDAYAWSGHYNVNRSYTVNGLNQQTAAGATALGYDARGNLTTSGTTSYAYNKLNQLTGSGATTLTYDPAGRLSQIAGSAGTTRFAYAGAAMIAEYNTGAALLRRYVPGPGVDEPVVWYEGAGTADRRWLHADERGSVIALSNASGAMLAINRYDEYGIPQSGNSGRFQYTGQAWLPELGMYSYKARMYSPTLGRFMQTDPIGYGDGLNWYNYVGSDPVNAVDPSGLSAGQGCTGTLICGNGTTSGPPAGIFASGGYWKKSGGASGFVDGDSPLFIVQPNWKWVPTPPSFGSFGPIAGLAPGDGKEGRNERPQNERNSCSMLFPSLGKDFKAPPGFYFTSVTVGLFAVAGGQVSYVSGVKVEGRKVVGTYNGFQFSGGFGVAFPTGAGVFYSNSNPVSGQNSRWTLQISAVIVSYQGSGSDNGTIGGGYPKGEGIAITKGSSVSTCHTGR